MNLEVNNPIGKPLMVSVVHFSEPENSWVVQGWWRVESNSFKTIKFPNHARSKIWVHMHNSDRSWGSQRAWTVIGEKFRYRVGGSNPGCPSGSNRRQVAFNGYDIGQTGVVRLSTR